MTGRESKAAEAPPYGNNALAATAASPEQHRLKEQAFRELMECHGDAIFAYCLKILRDRILAEDVIQQVFYSAYKNFSNLHPQGSSARTWLYSTARHRCLDALKSRRRREHRMTSLDSDNLDDLDPSPLPGDSIEREKLQRALSDSLNELSPRTREVILLRFTEGCSYEEIAQRLGTKADTARVRVTRALPLLKKALMDRGLIDK